MNSTYELLIVILTDYGFSTKEANNLLKSFLDEQAEKYISFKSECKIKQMFHDIFK